MQNKGKNLREDIGPASGGAAPRVLDWGCCSRHPLARLDFIKEEAAAAEEEEEKEEEVEEEENEYK